ncbi:MAG TPA: CHASE2 domain-containing protein [Casimicrobiaceae bacterium]|nr:CHASE2 domain-containing protein [Casimicrobiaceae bacterium]
MSLPAGSAATARRPAPIRLVAVPLLAALALLIWLAPRLAERALPAWLGTFVGLAEHVQSAWFDVYQLISPRDVVSMPATIVEIDEKSLAALGQWPWPRPVLAELIRDINRYRPAAIGIDILMPEADGRSLERLLAHTGIVDATAARQLAALSESDQELAKTIAAAPVVLAIEGNATATGMLLRVPPFVVSDAGAGATAGEPAAPGVRSYAGVRTSLDELDRSAAGHGLISVDPAGGGLIRRIPLVANVGGTLAPAFAIEMLRVAIGAPALRLLTHDSSVLGVQVSRDLVAPTEEDGAARVYYSKSRPDRFVSAVDVIDGKVDPQQIARKLVLIGVTGVGMVEDKNTPLGLPMPGVEIHAQLLENLFDHTLLRRPAWAPRVEALALLLLGSLLIYATPRWSARNSALLAVSCVALLLAAGYLAFWLQRLLFDAALPGMALMLLFLTLLVLTLAEATQQRKALEQLVQQEREQKARMAGELDAAKRVQVATLPRAEVLGNERRIDLAATMVPAREVGGDLYDFFRLDDRHLFFLVGDVAGKGLTASIFMAVSKALCKSTILRTSGADIGELMALVNAEVSRDNPEMLFVTAFAGVLDLESGELAYCNAGHENPYLANPADATVVRIEDGGGPPLCAVDDFGYRGAERQLGVGELICLVSDGVTEAVDPGGKLYGGERVRQFLERAVTTNATAGSLVAALRADVDAFGAGAEVADDLTVLVLRWNGARG